MWLRVLGLPTAASQWWRVVNPPAGPAGAPWETVDALLRHRFPGYHFAPSPRSEEPAAAGQFHTVVARPGAGQPPGSRGEGPDLTVVTEDGPDAGRLAPLPRSGLTVGRNGAAWRLADPFLSAPHFRLDLEPDGVRITELASRTEPSGRRDRDAWWHGERHHRAGSSEFRLARGRADPLAPARPLPELLIDPGAEPARPNPLLQAIMAAGPLVIGVVMAVVTGLWYFLMFSLVSVAVVVVMWSQHRTASRRHGRRIQACAHQIREQLEDLAPTPGRLSLAARSGAVDRFGVVGAAPADSGGPLIRWGAGTASLPLASERDSESWNRWATVGLPATSVLRRNGSTLVTAQPSTLHALAYWLQVQLCRDAVATGRGVLVRTRRGDLRWGGAADTGSGTVLCWPGTTVRGLPDGWHRVILRETSPSDSGEGSLDAAVPPADRLEPDRGLASLGGLEFTGFRSHGMSASTADWLLDEMGAAKRPPRSTGAADLALPEPLMAGAAVDALTVELASGAEAVDLDLVAHGPHLLVAGTTGSGKSELLLTLLTGMAAAHPAAEVSFVLMDFKGGSSFAALAGLPHTMSVETNLAEAESLRTFDALSAELRRREELFLAAGAADFRSYRRAHPGAELPRLVVAVDELRVLMDEHPQAGALLARLAATGRSLGFHLVLATQRAQGAVGPDIRSNLGTVICLRTATEQESWDLLGTAVALTIPADSPGQAFLKHGGQPARPFRAGQFSVATGPPALIPWTRGRPDAEPAPWPDLVALIRAEAQSRGLPVPQRAVTPALPDSWSPTPAERSAVPGAVVVGLVDLPRQRAQTPVRWHPDRDGPAAWIGTAAGGVDEAARTVLADWAASGEGAMSTVVLDGAGVLPSPGRTGPAKPLRAPAPWSVLAADEVTPDGLAETFDRIRAELARPSPVRLVVTQWGRWATQRVGSGYETVEDHLSQLMRDRGPGLLAVAIFGGRELAGGRLLGQVPWRFYLPAGTTPEHRMVWPTLHRVKELPGRAVMVCPEHPAPGVAVQLSGPPSGGTPPRQSRRQRH